jgi:hypothetical protein
MTEQVSATPGEEPGCLRQSQRSRGAMLELTHELLTWSPSGSGCRRSDPFGELLPRPVDAELDVKMAAEQLDAGLPDLLGDEHTGVRHLAIGGDRGLQVPRSDEAGDQAEQMSE